MTPEDQQIAIAEACGWRRRNPFVNACGGITQEWEKDGSLNEHHCRGHEIYELPDYLNDLNAMHEAEKVLADKTGHLSVGCLIRDYWLQLMQILNPGVKMWENGAFLGSWANAIKVGRATATQRSEAFLKTLGLWTP